MYLTIAPIGIQRIDIKDNLLKGVVLVSRGSRKTSHFPKKEKPHLPVPVFSI